MSDEKHQVHDHPTEEEKEAGPKLDTNTLEGSINTMTDKVKGFVGGSTSDDPIQNYLGTDVTNIDYKFQEKHVSDVNQIVSKQSILHTLKIMSVVGVIFTLFMIPLSSYALRFDLVTHLPQMMKHIPEYIAYVFTTLFVLAMIFLLKASSNALINNKYQNFLLARGIVVTFFLVSLGANMYFHYRFAVRITAQNIETIKEEELGKSNSVVGVAKGNSDLITGIQKSNINSLMKRKQTLSNRINKVEKKIDAYDEEIAKYTAKKSLTRSDISSRRAIYANKKLSISEKESLEHQYSLIDAKIETSSDKISSESSKVITTIKSLDEDLEEEASDRETFVFVIFSVFELFAMSGLFAKIVAVNLLPKSIKEEIAKMGFNASAIDMLSSHIRKLEKLQIGNAHNELTHNIEMLKVLQSSGALNSLSIVNSMVETVEHDVQLRDNIQKAFSDMKLVSPIQKVNKSPIRTESDNF